MVLTFTFYILPSLHSPHTLHLFTCWWILPYSQNMACSCDLALHTGSQIKASSARRKKDYSRKNGLLWIALQELGTIPGKSGTFQWALPVSFGCSSKAFHGILTMHASGDCFCQNFALKSHSLNTLRLAKEILVF